MNTYSHIPTKVAFVDNTIRRQPVKGKPHIALIGGYWRVTPAYWTHARNELTTKAQNFAVMQNSKIWQKSLNQYLSALDFTNAHKTK